MAVANERTVGTSTANTAQTVSTVAANARVLVFVTVAYSANVTQDVTVTLNSNAGAGYDTTLATISLSANRYGVYIPDEELSTLPGDAIDVTAPAGGAGVTSAIAIYTRRV